MPAPWAFGQTARGLSWLQLPRMFFLALFLLCLFVAGAAATAWLWSREPVESGAVGALEATGSWVLVTMSLAVAINWVLSPLHAIRAPFLIGTAIALAAAASVYLRAQARLDGPAARTLRSVFGGEVRVGRLTVAAVAAPLACWVAFITWRGTITPVLSHDGLAYHMPRAVDVHRTGGWRYLPVEDFRLSWFPADYELLLADVLALTGSEHATSLVSVLLYLAAFLLCASWGERRWGGGARAWIGALLWGSTPLALLHSGGHKNDVMMMICTVSLALWGARWVVRGGVAPLVLAVLAATLGIGTKANGAFAIPATLIAFVPFGLFPRLRSTLATPRKVAAFGAGSVAALLLLGITPLLVHLEHPHLASDMGMSPAEMASTNITPTYDGLRNLWRFPVFVWLRAFSNHPLTVDVPWLHTDWFWPKYELYFSDYGVAASSLALLVPVALLLALRWPRSRAVAELTLDERATRRERWAASIYLGASCILVLLMRYKIDGAFNSYARYMFFLPLLIADGGLILLLERVPAPRAQQIARGVTVAALSAFFFYEAETVGENDAFAPVKYVKHAMEDHDTRDLSIGVFARAGQVVDHIAGPNDRIAFEGDFGAWIYPAYGRGLTRPVDVLPLQAEARLPLVDAADWVVIDRFWAICWGSPTFYDMSDAYENLDRGLLSAHDVVFYNQMVRDPRFAVFYRDLTHAQVVFRRRPPPN